MAKDIPGASAFYAQCTNPAGKQACSQRVSQAAPKLAENAAFRQQCDQARMIIDAASKMGVAQGRMAKASAACK
jgi:hypothetical protein